MHGKYVRDQNDVLRVVYIVIISQLRPIFVHSYNIYHTFNKEGTSFTMHVLKRGRHFDDDTHFASN
jgi:hypothetical protein